jgi:hypothetical protein
MVALFDHARGEIKLDNVLIGSGVPKEDAFEVVAI